MKRLVVFLILCMVVGSLMGCGDGSAPTPMPTPMPVLTHCVGPAIIFGEISDDPNEVMESYTAFASYLVERLAPLGIECWELKVVDTIDEMVKLIKEEKVDIYMDSIYPATLVSIATGARPILRRWRNCDPDYYSVIFTTKESGITTLDDLRGHIIAMDTIYSTSGFVLPAVYLIDHGLNLVLKETYDEPVAENEVGIIFSYDDINTHSLVLDGKVHAGATDDYNYDKWEDEDPGKFIKLAETASVPRQVVIVRPGMERDLQDAIKDELSKAHLDPIGLEALLQCVGTCKFDDAPGGIDAAFMQMQEIHKKIIAIPGWKDFFQGDN